MVNMDTKNNSPSKTKKERVKPIDRFPPEGVKAVENFQSAFKVYFKNQTVAGKVLKVSPSTVNRYLTGSLLIPMQVANRFSIYTNGSIQVDDIFFDFSEWLYDQNELQKKGKKGEQRHKVS